LLAYASSSAIMTAWLEYAIRTDGVYVLGYVACALGNLVSLWLFAMLLGRVG
jgi:lipid-A-disaccharide synthase-like uncharacterized protein